MNDFLRVLFAPHYWVRNYKTSKALDSWMRNALESPVISEISQYHCTLNGKKIWIANYPYAFGRLAAVDTRLPSRATAIMLHGELSKHSEYLPRIPSAECRVLAELEKEHE